MVFMVIMTILRRSGHPSGLTVSPPLYLLDLNCIVYDTLSTGRIVYHTSRPFVSGDAVRRHGKVALMS